MGVQIVGHRQLRGQVGEPQGGEPRSVPARPRPPRPLVVDLAAQQELPQPVARAHQISANVLTAAHEVAQLLALERRDRHQRQLAGCQQPREPDRVPLVGLDPIPRPPFRAPRRTHRHLDPPRRARRASP